MLNLIFPALLVLSTASTPPAVLQPPKGPLPGNVLENYISSQATSGRIHTFRESPTGPEYRYYLGPLLPPQNSQIKAVKRERVQPKD
jgi:hypothetical protein